MFVNTNTRFKLAKLFQIVYAKTALEKHYIGECNVCYCSCCLLTVLIMNLIIPFDWFQWIGRLVLITNHIHIQLHIRRDFPNELHCILPFINNCAQIFILYFTRFDLILITFQVVLFKETPKLIDQSTDDKLVKVAQNVIHAYMYTRTLFNHSSKKRNSFL